MEYTVKFLGASYHPKYTLEKLEEMRINDEISDDAIIEWNDGKTAYTANYFFEPSFLHKLKFGENPKTEVQSKNRTIDLKCRRCKTPTRFEIDRPSYHACCKECGEKSIIEYKNGLISVKWKEPDIDFTSGLPDDLIEAMDFFNIRIKSINEKQLAQAYRILQTKYHPDKISGLAQDFQDLAHEKSAEINEKYNLIKSYLRKLE